MNPITAKVRPPIVAPISAQGAKALHVLSVVPSIQLDPGNEYVYQDRIVVIEKVASIDTIQVRDKSKGVGLTVAPHELSPLPAKRGGQDPLFVDEEAWLRAVALGIALLPFVERRILPGAIMLGLTQRFGLCERQVQRLRVKFNNDPRVTTLLPKKRGRAVGASVVAMKVEHVIAHVVMKHYARRERTSKADIVVICRAICRRLCLTAPSRNTVQLRIARVESYDLAVKRSGAKRAKQLYAPRPGKLFIDRALATCQIDHTLVDLLVLSDDRTQVLGRPWLSVAMDVATRVVLGIYLSMDAPSSVSVALCIEHAVMPKASESKYLVESWPMYGKPERVHVDNGPDFIAYALKRGCEQHGIDLTFRPPGTPHYGGHIERLMGTLMKIVHGVRGTTFSNVAARADYPAEERASMTLSELREYLVAKICKHYHLRIHRGLGTAPLIAWEEAWKDADGTLRLPPLIARPEDFRMDFLPGDFRRMRRTGIEFNCSRYWHPEMEHWIGEDRDILVRYRPDDASRVWFRTDDGVVLEAKAVAGRALGERYHLPLDAAQRERLEEGRAEGVELSEAIADNAVKETRKVKRTPAQNRPPKGRGGRKKAKAPDGSEPTSTRSILPEPNRASVTTEELF